MKTALAGGVQVQAGPDAPRQAACPCCGESVELRWQKGAWHYRHSVGKGAACAERIRPARSPKEARPKSGHRDPYCALGLTLAEQTVRQTRGGSLQAALALAFSPVISLALALAGQSPEETLDVIAPLDDAGETPEMLFVDDEAELAQLLIGKPGPVFDLEARAGHDLASSPWYVPLAHAGPASICLARRIVSLAAKRNGRRVYVLGTRERWATLLAAGS